MRDRVEIFKKILESVGSMLDVALDMEFSIEDKQEIDQMIDGFLKSKAIENMLTELDVKITPIEAPVLKITNTSGTGGITSTTNPNTYVKKHDPNEPLIIPMYKADTNDNVSRAEIKAQFEVFQNKILDTLRKSING